MRYMYKSIFLLAYYIPQLVPDISLSRVAKFPEKMELISDAADLFVFLGLNGAVNGSGVCPPTTQPGSFSANQASVQASAKPTKASDAANTHRSSPQNNPAELVEKPILKPKEKVSIGCLFTSLLESRDVTHKLL